MEVYWMGGSPCAGKTTIADIIAQKHGWKVYHIDRHFESYVERADPAKHPTLTAYKQMGLKHFLSLPVAQQCKNVEAISAEQFNFIMRDIAEIESEAPILVEGANILPDDAHKWARTLNHIIWVVPTEAFQLATYPRRGTWVQDVLRFHFAEAERLTIFDNWMQRDAHMARWTASRARDLGIRVITVDGSRTILENTALVEQHFGLPADESEDD